MVTMVVLKMEYGSAYAIFLYPSFHLKVITMKKIILVISMQKNNS